jgi:hypothetical protein
MSLIRYLTNKLVKRELERKYNCELEHLIKDLEAMNDSIDWKSGTQVLELASRAKDFVNQFENDGDLYSMVEVWKNEDESKVYCDLVCLDKGKIKRKYTWAFVANDLPVSSLE